MPCKLLRRRALPVLHIISGYRHAQEHRIPVSQPKELSQAEPGIEIVPASGRDFGRFHHMALLGDQPVRSDDDASVDWMDDNGGVKKA